MTEQEEFEFRHRFEKETSMASQPPNPAEGMSDWQKVAAGAGAGLSRLVRGAKQIVGLATPADEDEARSLEAPARASGAYEMPPIQSGKHGIHPANRQNRTVSGPFGLGESLGTMIPLGAISTLIPGANTILGSTAIGAGAGGLQAVGEGESRGKNVALGALAGGGSAALLKGAGMMTSKMLAESKGTAAAEASQQSVRDATIKAAQAEGYVLPPTVTGGGLTAKALESVGGKAAIGQEASIRNQEITNKIARRESGLHQDSPISEGTLEKARNTIAAPYREVAALSPRANVALEEMKSARNEAKLHWKEYNVSQKVSSLKEAERLDAKAEAYEKVIDSEAKKVGRSDLLPDLKEARVKLAKNYDVERALNLGDGNVDASIIGRMFDKRGEAGMSGGLATIGKFQQAFRTFAREAPTGQSAPGVSKLAPVVMSGGLGWFPAGMAMAGGPARSIALSKMMQTPPSYGPGMGIRLADIAANSPRLRAMVPAATAGAVVNAEQ